MSSTPSAPLDEPRAGWSEAALRALTLHSGDILSLLDAQGRLLYNSPAAERISGFSAAELAGVDTFDLIHPDDREAVRSAFARTLQTPGAVTTVQYRYSTRAGGWTWMEAVASNQLDNPEVRGVVTNSRDITERRRAEEERARLEGTLLHRQRLEGLGTLAGGIAHDFNNLLSALSAHVSLAQSASHQVAVREELEFAHAAIKRASELTRQLLGFARKQPAQAVVFDAGQALGRLRPLLERLLGGQVQVAFEAPATPVWLRLDPSQLEQVVVNLATNARDALPDGGHLRLSLMADGEFAELRVTDDGVGVPPEVLPRVFEPFFTTKEPGRGTGLGLAVSHGIVVHAGGTIELRAADGGGTTALVRLPLVASPAPAGEPTTHPERGVLKAREGERLLLADDDDLVRSATRRVLVRHGWVVDEVRDGLEAVARVEATPGAWAAAILDLRMPRLSGAAAAQRLRVLAPRLPLVFISGYSEDAEHLGAVLNKPFDGDTLAQWVREAIERGAA
jgi:PAS domain S-box-containing protein